MHIIRFRREFQETQPTTHKKKKQTNHRRKRVRMHIKCQKCMHIKCEFKSTTATIYKKSTHLKLMFGVQNTHKKHEQIKPTIYIYKVCCTKNYAQKKRATLNRDGHTLHENTRKGFEMRFRQRWCAVVVSWSRWSQCFCVCVCVWVFCLALVFALVWFGCVTECSRYRTTGWPSAPIHTACRYKHQLFTRSGFIAG